MKAIIVLLSLLTGSINGLGNEVDVNNIFMDLEANYSLPNRLILNGEIAPAGFAPYQASLRNKSGVNLCGGSILNSRWFLTAAHCLDDSNLIDYAYVGATRVTPEGKNYTIKVRVRHHSFNKWSNQNDIAMLKSHNDIVFNKLVQPIKLPTKDVNPGEMVTLTGWGRLTILTTPTYWLEELSYTSVRVLNQTECKTRLAVRAWGLEDRIFPTNLCTYGYTNSSCNGDEGGPAVINGVQYGIMSWNVKFNPILCNLNYPNVLTRLSHYGSWIWWTQLWNIWA